MTARSHKGSDLFFRAVTALQQPECALPMPPEYYTVVPGTTELVPMLNTSLQPVREFRTVLDRLKKKSPDSKRLLPFIEKIARSNLVAHGATCSTKCIGPGQRSHMILGSGPRTLGSNKQANQLRLVSSDFSTGTPLHTRITIRRRRNNAETGPYAPRQQIMTFNNTKTQKPHQASFREFKYMCFAPVAVKRDRGDRLFKSSSGGRGGGWCFFGNAFEKAVFSPLWREWNLDILQGGSLKTTE